MEEICRDAPVFLRQLLACELAAAAAASAASATFPSIVAGVLWRDCSATDALELGFEEEPDYAMMRGMCR